MCKSCRQGHWGKGVATAISITLLGGRCGNAFALGVSGAGGDAGASPWGATGSARALAVCSTLGFAPRPSVGHGLGLHHSLGSCPFRWSFGVLLWEIVSLGKALLFPPPPLGSLQVWFSCSSGGDTQGPSPPQPALCLWPQGGHHTAG